MGTTTEKLNYLAATKDAIKSAIVAKGVAVSASDTFRSYASKIRAIPQEGGGATVSEGAINFRDYDGTVLHAYSKDEFLALTEMPSLPTQPNLTCQGWNWTLDDAQAYVETYGVLEVGATYITDDGKTRLYITIAAEGRMDVPLYISQTVANGVTIDWGDGSPTETLSGTGNVSTTHTYAEIGDYVISLDVADGCTLGLGHASSSYCVMGSTGNTGRVYCNMLQRVEIGGGVTSIGNYAFYYCYSLSSVLISNSVKSISACAFQYCYSLSSIVISNSVTSIGNYAFAYCEFLSSIVISNSVTSIGNYAFQYCYSLSSIVIPNSVTSIGSYAFEYCYSLSSIVIPNSVTSIGSYAFRYCYSLSSIVIPDSVKSISAYAFYCCYSLSSVVIPDSVTQLNNYAFQSCHALSSVVIPDSVTWTGNYVFASCYSLSSVVHSNNVTLISPYAFRYCYSLSSIVIPDSVKSISDYAFEYCYSLSSVVIPDSVKKVGDYAFRYCYGIAFYDFSQHTSVPTLGTKAFDGISSDCKIIVPHQLYSEWIAATNWSTYANYIIMYYAPQECTSLEITADDVSCGNFNTTTVHWTAITKGVMFDGTTVEGVTFTGSETVNIGYNTTSGSVTKEVSYTYMGVTATTTVTQGAYIENCVACKYNATSTSSATTLMSSSFSNYSTYFSSMIVDGVETTIARTYTFSTTGEHEVIFKVADGASINNPNRMFAACTALTYVDCSELDLSAATSTSSEAGTAYMFSGCTGLQTIILPSTVVYLGHYMFYQCVNVTSLTIMASAAPTLYSYSTWGYSPNYILGYSNRSKGTNMFYVPTGATGYDSGYWTSYLQNTSYCGFTKVESDEL